MVAYGDLYLLVDMSRAVLQPQSYFLRYDVSIENQLAFHFQRRLCYLETINFLVTNDLCQYHKLTLSLSRI